MACDERQLPPTDFFTSGSADDEESDGSETDEATIRLTDGYESILDVLTALLPTRSLTWHYRSRDERLIA
ncbi:MAG TPA: hypothetical protein VES02_07040, partial [Dermatophilaceae bacterium]|nr:hypothetical protein [Dermatophilaceae bacterium]